jgi:hypothetical protein
VHVLAHRAVPPTPTPAALTGLKAKAKEKTKDKGLAIVPLVGAPRPEDLNVLAGEMHRLACLGRRRWGLNGVGVLHVEGVGVVRRAIDAIAA